MAKVKQPESQEGMVDINTFLKDPALVEKINNRINAYNMRPSPKSGMRWKRTPEDSFKEAGNFNAMWLIDEFLRITAKKSTLSTAKRDCVNKYVVSAMQELYYQTLKKKAEEVKNGKEESGDQGPVSE